MDEMASLSETIWECAFELANKYEGHLSMIEFITCLCIVECTSPLTADETEIISIYHHVVNARI